MDTAADNRRPFLKADLVCLPFWVLWLVALSRLSRGAIVDDAFIHLEFARNLVAGNGFAFKDVIVYGNTAPLWTLLLAALRFVLPDWNLTVRALALCGVLACMAGAWTLARAMAARWRLHAALPAAAVSVLVVNPFFAFFAFSGMEAVAALGAAFWLAWLGGFAEPKPSRLCALGLLAGLAPLLRPELALMSAAALLTGLRRFGHGPDGAARRAGRSRRHPPPASPRLAAGGAGPGRLVPLPRRPQRRAPPGQHARERGGHTPNHPPHQPPTAAGCPRGRLRDRPGGLRVPRAADRLLRPDHA